jgi:hypothetical protein
VHKGFRDAFGRLDAPRDGALGRVEDPGRNRAPVDRIDSRGDRARTVPAHIRACGERIVVAVQRHAVCLAECDTDVVGELGADPHEFDHSRVATL